MFAIGKVYIISNQKNFIEQLCHSLKIKNNIYIYTYAQNKIIRRKAGYVRKKK